MSKQMPRIGLGAVAVLVLVLVACGGDVVDGSQGSETVAAPSGARPAPSGSNYLDAGGPSESEAASVGGRTPRQLEIVTLLPFDAIPAIFNPIFVSADQATNGGNKGQRYRPDERVLGIEINGDARAYSVPLLSRHEVVNDVVGGVPVAITWCPLCFTGIGYAREIDGLTHTFGVSGKLIMNALVMYDQETGTLWSQFLGQGVRGVLQGKLLEPIPVTMTTWARWVEEFPDTVALDKSNSSVGGDIYESYYSSNQQDGAVGQSNKDNRLETKALVLGAGFDDGAIAYPLDVLREFRVVNDAIVGRRAVIYFDDTADTAVAFSSTIDGRELTFTLAQNDGTEILVDNETGSKWIPFTGTAFEGEFSGRNLKRIHSTLSFWFAWTDFYPDTDLFSAG